MRSVSITVAEQTLDDKGRRTRPVSELDHPVHKLVLLLPQDAVTRESSSRSLLQMMQISELCPEQNIAFGVQICYYCS